MGHILDQSGNKVVGNGRARKKTWLWAGVLTAVTEQMSAGLGAAGWLLDLFHRSQQGVGVNLLETAKLAAINMGLVFSVHLQQAVN